MPNFMRVANDLCDRLLQLPKRICALISHGPRTNNFITFLAGSVDVAASPVSPQQKVAPVAALGNDVACCCCSCCCRLELGLDLGLDFLRIVKYMQSKSHDSRDVAHIWAP